MTTGYRRKNASEQMRHEGSILLNTRINISYRLGKGDGKLPPGYEPSDVSVWNGVHPDWTVVRKAPRRVTWAKSTHGSAKVAHRVKYQLIATHKKGMVVQVTRWACDRSCHSAVVPAERPETNSERCWPCDRPIRIPRPISHD